MFAGLSVHTDNESLIVCNGYKDDIFIRTALIGRKLQKKVILIAEKLSEVRSIVRIAKEMGVEPILGLRVRLVLQGRQQAERRQAGSLRPVRTLDGGDPPERPRSSKRKHQMSNSLRLLHFHIGSQVPDILIIQRLRCRGLRVVREARRDVRSSTWKARRQQAPPSVTMGRAPPSTASTELLIEEYAQGFHRLPITDVCDEERVPHPHIVGLEQGSAIVAHHSVLVIEAFGAIEKVPPPAGQHPEPKSTSSSRIMVYTEQHLSVRNLGESWHDLLQIKEESQKMFELGLLNLEIKAARRDPLPADRRADADASGRHARRRPICRTTSPTSAPSSPISISVTSPSSNRCSTTGRSARSFRSFRIHRLAERPNSQSTIVDITCDSDGKVSKFIDLNDVKDTLASPHPPGSEVPYYLGIFLTGAYLGTSWATSTACSAASTRSTSSSTMTRTAATTSRKTWTSLALGSNECLHDVLVPERMWRSRVSHTDR